MPSPVNPSVIVCVWGGERAMKVGVIETENVCGCIYRCMRWIERGMKTDNWKLKEERICWVFVNKLQCLKPKRETGKKVLKTLNAFVWTFVRRILELSLRRSVFRFLPACLYYVSPHRGDRHLSMMDGFRHCFVTATSKRYYCDSMLDREPLTWIRSDIQLPI